MAFREQRRGERALHPDRGCGGRRLASGVRLKRAAVLLVALVLGCDGPGIVGLSTARLGRIGAPSASTGVEGTWRRVLYFLDDFGYARASETTYQFAADGTAVRIQVARNFTLGLADAVVSAGRWRLDNSRLTIDFVSPSTFQLAFDSRRVGDQLELGGQVFLRVVE